MTQTAVPAGWYQDPYDARSLRWWDGARWTEHAQAAPPPVPVPAPAPAPAPIPVPQPAVAAPAAQAPPQAAPPAYVPQQGAPPNPFPAPAAPQQPAQPFPPQAQQQQPFPPQAQQSFPPQAQQQPFPPQAQQQPAQPFPPQAQQQPAQPFPPQAQQQPAQPFPPQAQQQPFPPQAQQQPFPPQAFPQQQMPPGQAPAPGYAPQPVGGGAEAMLSAPLLAVNQNFKWVDVTTSYEIKDGNGNVLGSVAEVGQNGARKALRFVSNMDKYLSRSFEIRDAAGVPFLVLGRGTKVLKAKVNVTRPDGTPVGEIIQDSVIGHVSFDLVANGMLVGRLQSESWLAFRFTILDHLGNEVGRMARSLSGVLISIIDNNDYYFTQFYGPVPEPLRTLAVGAALTANTLLNPDTKGNE